jgi:hypothetical protein|tara:strand:- start:698 stop:856 length:159 start_codon:yes stop_codon:yes gene_type:complete
MNFFKRFLSLFSTDVETVRARDNKGRYIPDDPDTKENEAYVVRKKKINTQAN